MSNKHIRAAGLAAALILFTSQAFGIYGVSSSKNFAFRNPSTRTDVTVGSSDAAPSITVDARLAFESEYVFRGEQFDDQGLQPSVDISYKNAYAGIWVHEPVDRDASNSSDDEVDIYAGYTYDLNGYFDKDFTMDVGLSAYTYPSTSEDATYEMFVGASMDHFLTPTVYLYYDFDLDNFTTEFSGAYNIDLTDMGLANTSAEIASYLGFVDHDGSNDTTYYGGSLDFFYSFSESATMSVGVRVSGNDNNDDTRDSNVWWGTSVSAGF